jgi:hypothetical protein
MPWIIDKIRDILPNRPYGKTSKDNRMARLIDLNRVIDNINEVFEQLGGVSDLQQVTDLGNTTTNNINLDNSAIVLDNGSLLQKGYIDNGADGGIARICSIGYQDEWENGVQYFISQNSN